MNIQERAAKVLQEIDAALALAEKATKGPWRKAKTCVGIPAAMVGCQSVALFGIRRNDNDRFDLPNHKEDATFIAASRTGWPTALRCLKTAIEELLPVSKANYDDCCDFARNTLTTICNQWESK